MRPAERQRAPTTKSVLIRNYCVCNTIERVKRPGGSHEGVGREKRKQKQTRHKPKTAEAVISWSVHSHLKPYQEDDKMRAINLPLSASSQMCSCRRPQRKEHPSSDTLLERTNPPAGEAHGGGTQEDSQTSENRPCSQMKILGVKFVIRANRRTFQDISGCHRP